MTKFFLIVKCLVLHLSNRLHFSHYFTYKPPIICGKWHTDESDKWYIPIFGFDFWAKFISNETEISNINADSRSVFTIRLPHSLLAAEVTASDLLSVWCLILFIKVREVIYFSLASSSVTQLQYLLLLSCWFAADLKLCAVMNVQIICTACPICANHCFTDPLKLQMSF